MLTPNEKGLIITGNTCSILLYSDTETRDWGWRAGTGYDLVRSVTISGDWLVDCFTQENRGRPLWSQGAFRLCTAAGLPQEGDRVIGKESEFTWHSPSYFDTWWEENTVLKSCSDLPVIDTALTQEFNYKLMQGYVGPGLMLNVAYGPIKLWGFLLLFLLDSP